MRKIKFYYYKAKLGVVFFGVDSPNIYASESAVQFIVQSVKDLAIIINHFDKFPLLSQRIFFYFEDKSFILC